MRVSLAVFFKDARPSFHSGQASTSPLEISEATEGNFALALPQLSEVAYTLTGIALETTNEIHNGRQKLKERRDPEITVCASYNYQ